MTLHQIEPDEQTVHGLFSREFAPVLEIDSGDTVRYRTLDAGWGLEPPDPANARQRRTLAPRFEGLNQGHALCGPVAIRGAKPGMTLEIGIDVVQPATWGATYSGYPNDLNRQLGVVNEQGSTLVWQMDMETMVGTDQHGHSVALRPFLGVIGMPPPEPGHHSTIPPRLWGGNLDCKELVAGSTLYLPIPVDGALVSVGDGHGTQADGEVSGTAIECGMERADLTYRLREELHLDGPRANTPAGWITFGFDHDLNKATVTALNAMLDLMVEQHNLRRGDALALASLVVDMRITQIVNDVWGVHAVLPHDALR